MNSSYKLMMVASAFPDLRRTEHKTKLAIRYICTYIPIYVHIYTHICILYIYTDNNLNDLRGYGSMDTGSGLPISIQ